MKAQDETFNVGHKWKDSCPTPYSRTGTIVQTERCQLFLPACDSLFRKIQQRPGGPHFCCAGRVEDLYCLPANDHMREAFTVHPLAASLQPAPEAAGRAEGTKAACQPSPFSAGLHRHCIVITETTSKGRFTDIRF